MSDGMLRSFVAKTVSGHELRYVASGSSGLRDGLGNDRKHWHDVHRDVVCNVDT